VCRKEKIDVVYGWWPVAYFASIFSGTPMVADMPEFLEKMYKTFKKKFPMIIGPILRNFQIIVAKRSKAIITESKEAKEEWVKRGIKSSKLHYRPYGIEVDFFNSQMNVSRIKKKLGVPKKELLVMYHGDIGHDDGVDILLRACKEVDLWCVVIGDGPEDYIRSLKKIAGKKTIFTGWINYSEIPAYLKNCDIYAAPFRSSEYTNTTYPLKQMEAMAAGKAVICSRLKAFSSTVEHKKDIFLVKPGKIEELKIAIKTLADNKKLRLKLGKNAHQTAIKKFGWEKRVKVDIGVIKEIYNLEIRK
jgi:glycosyltransferase involved in cell wall biosynthesis